jgi:[ribosomal protein S5]-alanine N-acetyltransferase
VQIPPCTLTCKAVTLREITRTDAPSLAAVLTAPEVSRFVASPPSSTACWQRFIAWAIEKRGTGALYCWVIVPHEQTEAVGLLQLRRLGEDWRSAEYGKILAAEFWGTDLSRQATDAALSFAFETIGVERLQARVFVGNRRAERALAKLGAAPVEVLPSSGNCSHDPAAERVWVILAAEWRRQRAAGNCVPSHPAQ